MVELSTAALRVKVHAALVKLEAVVRGVDGDRNGADGGAEREQRGLVISGHVVEVHQRGAHRRRVEVALASDGLVRVRSLGIDTGLNDVLEGVVHQTAVAALIALGSGAINQILLGERNQLASGLEVSTLGRAGGGESPAAARENNLGLITRNKLGKNYEPAALALILDGGYVALSGPVDGGGQGSGEDGHGCLIANAVGVLAVAVVHGAELGRGQITKVIHGNGETSGLGVKALDKIHVLAPDGHTLGALVH